MLEHWRVTFRAASGVGRPLPAVAFGRDAREADRLGALIASGDVTATTGLLAEFRITGHALPRADDHMVVVDGGGAPLCIVRVTDARVCRRDEIDSAHARAEAADGTTCTWRATHEQRLADRCAALGVEFNADVLVVCIRFVRVWPA